MLNVCVTNSFVHILVLSVSHTVFFVCHNLQFVCNNNHLSLHLTLKDSAKVLSLCCMMLEDTYLVLGQLMQLLGSGPVHLSQNVSHS